MKVIQINKPNSVQLIVIDDPKLKSYEVLIKVMACGICGTDIHILRGDYIGDYPVIPGHEFSGEIVEIGKNVTRFKVGDRVAIEPNISCDNCYNCLNNRQNFCENWQAIGVTLPGGMAQYVAAPEKAVFPLVDLPFEYGAFVEPLSCVLHGLHKTKIQLADKAAILGAGPIGLLLLQMVRRQGAERVDVIEKQKYRAKLAQEFGADSVFNSIKKLKKDFYDVVIDATGAPAIMEKTLNFVKHGGKVLLFGVPPRKKEIKFEAFPIFRKGLTILSSFTSLRNSYQAISLLQSKHINVLPIISHKLPLSEFELGVELIEKGMDNVRKIIILPN